MRKIYLLVASAFIGATSFGQTNLSYEEAVTHPAAPVVPEVGVTAGWQAGIYTQSTDASHGDFSIELTTVNNPAFASQGLNPTQPGQIFQSVTGSFDNNGANITGSVDFKADLLAGDTALIIFEIYDTLAAGISDDVLLYSGSLFVTQSVTTWTTQALSMQQIPGATGTANEFYFGGLSGFNQLTVGSTLQLDNWVIEGLLGVEKIEVKNSFVAFPNPATDVLNITAAEAIESVSVLSLDGKVVSVTKGGKVDVSNLTTGVYIYEATTVNGAKAINKFVKK